MAWTGIAMLGPMLAALGMSPALAAPAAPLSDATVPVPAPAPVPSAQGEDVLVYGQRLDAAYRACRAGGCGVLRDAQVSIAYAEQQFRAGAYLRAKATLSAAVQRNRAQAATAPRPVAALYEAYATVAIHDGDTGTYRRAVRGQVRTLRETLPADDPARRRSGLVLGDMWLRLGKTRDAGIVYAAAQRQAEAVGDTTVAVLAQMRRASLAAATDDLTLARRLVQAAESGPAAGDPALRAIIRVTALRIATRGSDDATMDRLVREIGAVGARPALLFAPPFLPSADAGLRDATETLGDANRVGTAASAGGAIEWADIGFWIGPDGHTRDAEVLRGVGARRWARPVLRQVAARRYTGFADPTGQGVYQIERVTNRGTYAVPTGSLIERRGGARTIEVLPLTGAPGVPIAAR